VAEKCRICKLECRLGKRQFEQVAAVCAELIVNRKPVAIIVMVCQLSSSLSLAEPYLSLQDWLPPSWSES
jgi:hypothetical protein